MRMFSALAAMLAAAAAVQPAYADILNVPVGGTNPKPVPIHPVDSKDSPEEIAKDAARDLRDSMFYNKPGATRAQYDADWQECRLIARGSRTPAGTIPYYYNPAVISPIAAGVGGAIGGLIGAAIAEGAQRRANRRSCLLIRGWRLVKVPSEAAARVSAMSDADRGAYFNTIVGAQNVEGEITERKNFSMAPEAVGDVSGPVSGPDALFFGKKVDTLAPLQLAADEGAVVVATRRPTGPSAGRFVRLALARYDRKASDLIYQPRDWKKTGDKTTYNREIASGNRKAGYEVQVVKLTPGDYVITGASVGGPLIMSTNCFGAPTFHVGVGEVLYLGDFVPVWGAPGADGKKLYGLGYANRIEDSRRLLSGAQPQLAAAMKPATIENGATYACSAVTMDRWDIAGAAMIAPPVPEPETPRPEATAAASATAN
ncbi:MAG: hypothetical protein ACJ8D6_02110 [Sphingomicrobium sp.]